MDGYINRIKELEEIAKKNPGVESAFAMQAGRELRIVVESQNISDEDAGWMARDLAKKVEAELTYPGQIKITVITVARD